MEYNSTDKDKIQAIKYKARRAAAEEKSRQLAAERREKKEKPEQFPLIQSVGLFVIAGFMIFYLSGKYNFFDVKTIVEPSRVSAISKAWLSKNTGIPYQSMKTFSSEYLLDEELHKVVVKIGDNYVMILADYKCYSDALEDQTSLDCYLFKSRNIMTN